MTHSRKIEAGVRDALVESGLIGVVKEHFDVSDDPGGYPKTIIKVDSVRLDDADPSENMYESSVIVEYRNDGGAQVDLDDQSGIIESVLSDQVLLATTFNYANPYVPIEDERPIKGVHFHQSRGTSQGNDFEGTIAQVDFVSTFITQAVIDNP